ncbi:MAG: DNA-binding protein [Deltaproteobacteria bacterium CG07_land_8_20_14_0_80_60_11]|nr:MAG: DNA-binding protein [Deltaproteobacteria bacterium CG07_land_8_20_14_0_80_60_11]
MPVQEERIEQAILLIRGEKVMLDADLAALYGVATRVLIQAVKRNAERFPPDFMFQLTKEEVDLLRSQIGTSKPDSHLNQGESEILRSQIVISKIGDPRGGRRYLPYAFTEQGVAMLSSVLHSPRAIAVNIEIMRTFIRLRRMLASHADLARKLESLEKKYDAQFRVVFDAIRQLMAPPASKRRRIGFHRDEG